MDFEQNPTLTAKRDIAKAFGIKGVGADRPEAACSKSWRPTGIWKSASAAYQDPDRLPPVSVLVVSQDATRQGDLFAKPMEWQGEGARTERCW